MTTLLNALRRFYYENPQRNVLCIQCAGEPDLLVTYHQLMNGANAYARTYEREGLKPGEVILLILQHGQDLVHSFFGAVLHGAIPAIMPFLTEKLTPERYRSDLASLITITKPASIVTYPEFESEVRAALRQGDSVRTVIVTTRIEPKSPPDFDLLPGMQRSPGDIALLQHSSGTTGLQKGVALSHTAVMNQLEAYRLAIQLVENDVIVSWLPLYHDMGLIAGFLMPVLLGVLLVLISPFDWVRAPYRLFQAISGYRGTLSWLPNFAYNFCAQKIRDSSLAGVDLSSWRAVINCSEPVRWESHHAFYERFKSYGLRCNSLQTCYAMAENVFAVTQSKIGEEPVVDLIDRQAFMTEWMARPAIEGQPASKMMSSGRPISNAHVRILDGKGHDLPERHIGEIALQTDCMLTGYYNRPDITRKALRGGWYLTGDYGYMAVGEVFVSGRKKDMIIVGGKNVYPQDLEALTSEIPGVHTGRAVAFGVFDDDQGTEEVVIVAEVDTDELAERQRISDAIRQHVTKNSAIALRHVKVVGSKWIVKTSSGKTARAANKEKYLREVG
jgi:acyl-CoA synthetase (AMP-forming)/AMP-acid ligase II